MIIAVVYVLKKPAPKIKVFQPTQGQILDIEKDLVVEGEASLTDSRLNYILKDSKNNELIGNVLTLDKLAPAWGKFSDSLPIGVPETEDGILEFFILNPQNQSKEILVTVPVKFKFEKVTVKVYFNNSKFDPEGSCNKVFPVNREIVKTPAIARLTIKELLKGPTKEEKNQGYFSSIPDEQAIAQYEKNANWKFTTPLVVIKTIKIEDGTAYVDFNDAMKAYGGGSCRVSAISSQISETLKQFPTIKEVVISIDGEPDALQP